jgi:hypothetical protein
VPTLSYCFVYIICIGTHRSGFRFSQISSAFDETLFAGEGSRLRLAGDRRRISWTFDSGGFGDPEVSPPTAPKSFIEICTPSSASFTCRYSLLSKFRSRKTPFPPPSGANFAILGQVCIVSFCDFWNEYLGQEFVIAIGQLDRNEHKREVVQQRLREHASDDLWGDLRHRRTSIVHYLGVATYDVANCKFIKGFKPGNASPR